MLVAVVAMSGGVCAMAAESQTLATSAAKPIALGGGPAVVTLAPPSSNKAEQLSARVTALRQDRKVHLVLKGLSAKQPPETLYQVYLGLPPGVEPKPDGIYYVGSVNFFNAVEPRDPSPDARSYSFDVTDLMKSLQSLKSLGDTITATIVPAAKARASAKPSIGEIALLAQ